jgi:hypothetical protein
VVLCFIVKILHLKRVLVYKLFDTRKSNLTSSKRHDALAAADGRLADNDRSLRLSGLLLREVNRLRGWNAVRRKLLEILGVQ